MSSTVEVRELDDYYDERRHHVIQCFGTNSTSPTRTEYEDTAMIMS